jgi:hypothetical protein
MKCPKCSEECNQDEVDVGVGVIYGPARCPNCGWCEEDRYNELLKQTQNDVKHIDMEKNYEL